MFKEPTQVLYRFIVLYNGLQIDFEILTSGLSNMNQDQIKIQGITSINSTIRTICPLRFTIFEFVKIIYQTEAGNNLEMGVIKWQNCDFQLRTFKVPFFLCYSSRRGSAWVHT